MKSRRSSDGLGTYSLTGPIRIKLIRIPIHLKVGLRVYHFHIVTVFKKYLYYLGYAFLIYEREQSVHSLVESAHREEDGRYFLCLSSVAMKDKPVSSILNPVNYQLLYFKH